MEILVAVLVSIAINAVAYLLTPKPKSQAPTAGALDIPATKDGTPIPVIFGEVWIKDPHIAYYGNANTRPITKSGGKK